MGSKLNVQNLIETVTMIDGISDSLDAAYRNIDEIDSDATEQLKEVKSQLDQLRMQVESPASFSSAATVSRYFDTRPRDKIVREAVDCPICNTSNDVYIGASPGASASVLCINRECGARFNAHRRADLTVFSKGDSPLGVSGAPYDEYTRVWRQQKFRLVDPPEMRNSIAVAFASCLTNRPAKNWDELEFSVGKDTKNSFSAEDIKKVRQILFKCQVFDFSDPEIGIRLAQGVNRDNVLEVMCSNLISRIVNEGIIEPNTALLAKLLLGDENKKEEIDALLVRVLHSQRPS